jgi:hypothetical protein
MAINRGNKGEISSDTYAKAFIELLTLIKEIPENDSILLSEIADRKHPVLQGIIKEYPLSRVHDLSGQPVLNIVGI